MDQPVWPVQLQSRHNQEAKTPATTPPRAK